MLPSARRALLLAAFATASCSFAASPEPLYHIASTLRIKSAAAPAWDYLAFDAAHSVLYIARRDDGILAYDTRAKKILGTLAGSQGGNAVVLVPEQDRGYIVHEEGLVTPFSLATRKTAAPLKVGENADNGVYDAATGQVIVMMGDSQQVAFLDARTGELRQRLHIDSQKIEMVAPDGQGKLYVALRDRNKVLRVDARSAKVEAEFATAPSCEQPNGMAYDAEHRRVFVGCRGTSPVLATLDADSGRVVATTPIGRGNDMVIFDASQRRIYTSNGIDANMVVIAQDDADHYRLVEATTTRPNARTMAFDPKTKDVYLVAAEGAVDASRKWSTSVAPFYPNTYFKDTFTLLTLSRR
jgi:DNA-binding beta-propeller fold protein YncE